MRAPVLVWILLAAVPASAATLHVCPDGSGQYMDLQSALAAAVSGDEIELCAGVFTGYGNVDLHFGPRNLVLRSLNGPEATTIDFAWLEDGGWGFDEYLAHPGIFLDPGTSTRIEGITLAGAGNRLPGDPGDGSTVHCIGGTVTLDRVHLRSPFGSARALRGGGVLVEGGALAATDCVFQGFHVHDEGAAVFADGSVVALRGCTFRGNSNGYGGALWLGSGAEITECLFEENSGPGNPGVVITVDAGQVVVTGSTFRDNFAQCVLNRGQLLVQECHFEDNVAELTAAIQNSGTARVLDSTFRRDLIATSGPTSINSYGQMEIEGCLFSDNVGGIYAPCTVRATGGTLTIAGTTFSGNVARAGTQGSAVVVAGTAVGTLERTIIAFGNGLDAVRCQDSGALSVACCDFFGNQLGDWTGCAEGLLGVAGNISADPLFCDAGAGDLSLLPLSPCAPPQSGSCGVIGALSVGCGPTAVQEASWGQIKALYR